MGLFLIGYLFLSEVPPGLGQPSDQNEELLRLEYTALLSVEQGDFNGAALTMGKAALHSLLLSQETQPNISRRHHLIREKLYRTREQVYRAYALFQQSGETIPAPSVVCLTLTQGKNNAEQARHDLKNLERLPTNFNELKTELQEWEDMVSELQMDFHCPL